MPPTTDHSCPHCDRVFPSGAPHTAPIDRTPKNATPFDTLCPACLNTTPAGIVQKQIFGLCATFAKWTLTP